MLKWLISISLVVIIIIGIWLWKIKDNFDWDYKIKFIDLSKTLQGKLGLNIGLSVKNNNSFGLNLSGLYVEIYYKDRLISKTTQDSGSFYVAPNSNSEVLENVSMGILLDKYSGDMVASIIGKKPIKLDTKIGVKLFGIPVGFNVEYIYKDYE